MPLTRIERVASPLPRECSTTELQGPKHYSGAGEGNRTLVVSLEGFCSTIELHPLIPSPLFQWVFDDYPTPLQTIGGGGWIRTNVGVSQQIYSLPPLATRAPLRETLDYRVFLPLSQRQFYAFYARPSSHRIKRWLVLRLEIARQKYGKVIIWPARRGEAQDAPSRGEARLITYGLGIDGKLLVVCHTERGDTIRIISARVATNKERKRYEA